MTDEGPDIAEIISGLNQYEKRVLRLVGSYNISQHKNIRKETIKDRLPDKYGKKVDKAIDSLKSKGLLFPYRHKNYGLSSLGVLVAQELVKQFQNKKYKDLNKIMMIFNP